MRPPRASARRRILRGLSTARTGPGSASSSTAGAFPTDAHGLAHFDGTALYEHADPRQGFHPDWNTAIYNFGRREVMSYLCQQRPYWSETFHIDGLRVDAVASMLYLDYSAAEGEWIPNKFGGRENRGGRVPQATNRAVYGSHPAPSPSPMSRPSWPASAPRCMKGKAGLVLASRNMGWDARHAQYCRAIRSTAPTTNDLTPDLRLRLQRISSCRSAMTRSHGRSMIAKMPGDGWQKFANLRAYYSFMWGYPAEALFMYRSSPKAEWSEARGLDWQLDIAEHRGGSRRWCAIRTGLSGHAWRLHQRDREGEGSNG